MVAIFFRQARGPASRPCHPTPWRPRPRERYERRRPERTPLYRVITRHLETWLATRSRAERPVPTHVELDRLADLIPPPRRHRHRYHGVFAPNHPLRPAVTALDIGKLGKRGDAASQRESPLPLHRDPLGPRVHQGPLGPLGEGQSEGAPDARPGSHDTARIAWAQLIARIAEAFPLVCPGCGGDIRLIAFIP